MSKTVQVVVVKTSTDTRAMERARSRLERTVISPGSPRIRTTSSTPSIAGSSQGKPSWTPSGTSRVRAITTMTAAAMGHRASPTISSTFASATMLRPV